MQRFMERADTSGDGQIDEGEFVAFLARMTQQDSDEKFARRMDFLEAAVNSGRAAKKASACLRLWLFSAED